MKAARVVEGQERGALARSCARRALARSRAARVRHGARADAGRAPRHAAPAPGRRVQGAPRDVRPGVARRAARGRHRGRRRPARARRRAPGRRPRARHRGGDLRRARAPAPRTRRERRRRRVPSSRTCAACSPGDYVVHAEHGIGRYQGLVHKAIPVGSAHRRPHRHRVRAAATSSTCPSGGSTSSRSTSGGESAAPKLDRLGGSTFARTKARVAREVRKMADELLRLYAERQALPGHALAAGRRRLPRLRGDVSLRRDRRPGARHRRREQGPRVAPDRWTASSAATSASARPRSPCAPRSAWRWRASRWRSSARRPCSRSSTFARSRRAWPATRSACGPSRASRPRRSRRRPLVGLKDGKVDIVVGHAPPALEGRPLQAPGPARRRRGAALRRRPQGAHQAAPRAGRRAHAHGDAHPAHAPDGRHRPARPVAHHDGARRPARRAHHRHALGRPGRARGGEARARARRAGLLRLQPHRQALREGAAAPGARADGAHRGGARADERGRARGGDARLRRRALRRARVDGNRRERPRHPAREHDDHRPRRPLRPRAALPAARARRAQQGARVLLPRRAARRTR